MPDPTLIDDVELTDAELDRTPRVAICCCHCRDSCRCALHDAEILADAELDRVPQGQVCMGPSLGSRGSHRDDAEAM